MRKLFIFAIAALGMLACNPNDSNNPTTSDLTIQGILSGKFSVSEFTQVQFSQGNLQYQASTQTWRFAEHQYDIIGADNANISSSDSGWIDLFGWGTGNNPTLSSMDYNDYATFTDWGVNAIFNGGNKANQWRTLTDAEWVYLFKGRPNAQNLFGLGSVNGINGTILLPDNWTTPSGLIFYASTAKGLSWQGYCYINSNANNFSHNAYTSSEWLKMEAAGAVFLPAAGQHYYGTGVYDVGKYGLYWSATPVDVCRAYTLFFSLNCLNPVGDDGRNHGLPVRLVR